MSQRKIKRRITKRTDIGGYRLQSTTLATKPPHGIPGQATDAELRILKETAATIGKVAEESRINGSAILICVYRESGAIDQHAAIVGVTMGELVERAVESRPDTATAVVVILADSSATNVVVETPGRMCSIMTPVVGKQQVSVIDARQFPDFAKERLSPWLFEPRAKSKQRWSHTQSPLYLAFHQSDPARRGRGVQIGDLDMAAVAEHTAYGTSEWCTGAVTVTETTAVTDPDQAWQIAVSWGGAARLLSQSFIHNIAMHIVGNEVWVLSGYGLLDAGLISKNGDVVGELIKANEDSTSDDHGVIVLWVMQRYIALLEAKVPSHPDIQRAKAWLNRIAVDTYVSEAQSAAPTSITAEPPKEYDCDCEPRVAEDDAPWSEMYSPLKVLFQGKDPARRGRSPHIGGTQIDDAVKQITAGGTLHGGMTILETTAAPAPDTTLEANLTWADTLRILRHAHQHQIRYCFSYPGADWGISGFELLDAGLIDNHAQVTCKLAEAEEQECAEAVPNSWVWSVMAKYVDLLTANCPGDPRIKLAQVWMRELQARQVLVNRAIASVN